ncbi:MAG: tRNA pseudouridine(55) synthase TruB [Hyphomonadaceae bacterium]
MRHALVDIVAREICAIPRCGGPSVTIGEVRASPDLKHMTVSRFGAGPGDPGAIAAGLGHCAGFLRGRLACSIDLRFTPELHLPDVLMTRSAISMSCWPARSRAICAARTKLMSRRKKGEDVSGWVVLDKPDDMSSTHAVSAVRRIFNAQKAGHAGTLDPLASGVLPIALGEATKTVPWLMEARKTYLFTIKWGVSTDTQDREGKVIAESAVRPSPEAIRAALADFTGEIEQVPPQFSAVKVDGERAYDIARSGEAVELAPRKVVVYEAELAGSEGEDLSVFRVRSGKGFYIRALVRDLAAKLGAEGHVWRLRRTEVGPFAEAESVTLDALEDLRHKGAASERLKPVETALDDIPALAINGEDAFKLRQGRPIVLLPHVMEALKPKFRDRTIAGQDASRAAVALFQGRAVALGDVRAGKFSPTRVFHIANE